MSNPFCFNPPAMSSLPISTIYSSGMTEKLLGNLVRLQPVLPKSTLLKIRKLLGNSPFVTDMAGTI